jgi:hypothetical protein
MTTFTPCSVPVQTALVFFRAVGSAPLPSLPPRSPILLFQTGLDVNLSSPPSRELLRFRATLFPRTAPVTL